MAADPDLDQVRIPKGSLFVELFCPRSPLNQDAPTDLYNYDATNGWSLALDKCASDGSPVWRIVVSQSRFKDAARRRQQQQRREPATCQANPDSSAIEPEQCVGDPYAEFSMLSYQAAVSPAGARRT